MKRFSCVSGGLAVLLAVSTAAAVEPAIRSDLADVQPVSVSSLLGDDLDKPAQHGSSCECCEPLWNIYVGAVILKRDSPSALPEFDFDFEPGVDVDIRRRLGSDYQLQVRYFGVDDWSDSLLVPVLDIPGFGTFFDVDADYSSNLHSTEVNLRRTWTDRLSVLAGFRWVELGEDLNLADFIGPIADISTNNHMYGGQVGAEWRFWDRGGPFTADIGAKAGIYYSDANARGSLLDGFVVSGAEDEHTAFLGELAVTGTYALSDNWAVRAGYQLVWIEGVATVDQQEFDNQTGLLNPVGTGGSPFYHGATVGVEFRY